MMRLVARSLFVLVIAFVAGCGVEGTKPANPQKKTPAARELPQPSLRMIGPTGITAGQTITIMGQGFADPEVGQTRIRFEGVYQTTSGKANPVQLEVVPTYVNQGVLRWTFGPNIPFTTSEDTGNFRGVVKAINVGRDGRTKAAPQALGAELQVLPSILIRQMRPLSAGCGLGLTDTTENTKFIFELKAIGLKSGTDIAPLRFAYTFLREQFQFSGYLANQLSLDPESLFPKKGAVTVVDEVKNGTVSTLGAGAPHRVHVAKGRVTEGLAQIASGSDRLFGLVALKTAPIPSKLADHYQASVTVVAVDSTGQQARRTIPLTVWSPVGIDYTGHTAVVRSFDPVPVSGCIPGGVIGRDVTYAEQVAESRSRTFTVKGAVKLEGDIWVARLSAEFGVEVTGQVTSAQSKDLSIVGKVLPKEFGVFYRQTLQLERRAKLTSHSVCGNSMSLGEVVVTDWVWSPDLAKGRACPPLPISNLPKGKIFKPVN